MLKKLTILIALLTLTLTACGAAQGQTRSQSGAPATGKLNAMSELIIGTLKLDGTSQAVTKEQAAELIPLWQVYKQLMSSDTAAQDEIDGLARQIKEAMTARQLQAISAMKLTQADMMSYMQQARPGGSAQGSSGTATGRNSNSGGFPGGGMPPGGMPPGGMPGGDFGGSQRQAPGTQTPNQTVGARGGMDRVPSMLIDTLIQYLKKLSAS